MAGNSGAEKKVAAKKGWLWGTIVHSQKYPMAKPICKSDRQHIYELHIIQGIQPKNGVSEILERNVMEKLIICERLKLRRFDVIQSDLELFSWGAACHLVLR